MENYMKRGKSFTPIDCIITFTVSQLVYIDNTFAYSFPYREKMPKHQHNGVKIYAIYMNPKSQQKQIAAGTIQFAWFIARGNLCSGKNQAASLFAQRLIFK
jgi:hypothetical protein